MAEKELLEQTLNGSVNLLTDILSMVDPDAFGRAQQLRDEIQTVAAWVRSTRKWELELPHREPSQRRAVSRRGGGRQPRARHSAAAWTNSVALAPA